jgi:hypothetical protein
MRKFTLKCLASAYRRLDLKDEQIDQLLTVGHLTPERVGRYTQPNYRPIAEQLVPTAQRA